MNKQELINKLKSLQFYSPKLGSWQDGYNTALLYAIEFIEELNEQPIKHKHMKEIADKIVEKFDNEDDDEMELGKNQETGFYYIKHIKSTPTHYQGTIQPIDLINAQDLNFNLGNVVKYACRAGKKQGENIMSDLEKAKDYINFEIERLKHE